MCSLTTSLVSPSQKLLWAITTCPYLTACHENNVWSAKKKQLGLKLNSKCLALWFSHLFMCALWLHFWFSPPKNSCEPSQHVITKLYVMKIIFDQPKKSNLAINLKSKCLALWLSHLFMCALWPCFWFPPLKNSCEPSQHVITVCHENNIWSAKKEQLGLKLIK